MQGCHKPSICLRKKKKKAISVKCNKAKCNKTRCAYTCTCVNISDSLGYVLREKALFNGGEWLLMGTGFISGVMKIFKD